MANEKPPAGAKNPTSSRVTLSTGRPKAPPVQRAVNPEKAAHAATEKIEDRALALFRDKLIPESMVFTNFVEKIAPKLTLPRTSRRILKAFQNPDVKAERVANCLKGNPYYEHQFYKAIQAKSGREELPSLEA